MNCYQCSYNETGYCKKKTKNCEVGSTYCYDFNIKFKNGSQLIGKDCVGEKYCKEEKEACRLRNSAEEMNGTIKDCSIVCCMSDLCNDNFSDTASSVSLQFACWMIILASLSFVT